jgi:polyhydroxyalkanoate synthase
MTNSSTTSITSTTSTITGNEDTQHKLAAPDLDSLIQSRLAKLTGGTSPASAAAAWMDWAGHLATAPATQLTLALQAWQGAVDAATAPAKSTDRRFAAPQWQQWPYDRIAQNYVNVERWWQQAASSVPGVSTHHAQQAAFFAQQLLDLASPANFLPTNPEALQATLDSGGANLLQGAHNQVQDLLHSLNAGSAVRESAYLPGRDVAITPGQVVFRNHLIELIQYAPQTATVFAEPVLIVPPWIMKYYILDLQPADSLVRYLVEHGHTVFIVSWRNPGPEDRALGMDDYLQLGVVAALNAVAQIVPKRQVQALGYCLGGTLLSIAAATLAREGDERLKSLSLLTTELDFSEPGDLSLFIDDQQLRSLEGLMAEQGYLDSAQMAGAFTLLNARDLVFSRNVSAYLLGRQAPTTDLNAWNADGTRMPFRQHSEYLRGLYRDNDLARGRYKVGGKPVVLSDIRVPIFALGTQRDNVVPWKTAYKVRLLTRSELTFCLSSGGHNVGVVNPPASADATGATGATDASVSAGPPRSYRMHSHSADARYQDPDSWLAETPSTAGSWWPAWEAWLRSHASKRVKPPAMGNEAAGLPPLQAAPGQYVLMN